MSSPPPLKPEPEPTEPKPHTPRIDINQIVEALAESSAGDYLTAIATGLKAFRDARRKRREPEEREI